MRCFHDPSISISFLDGPPTSVASASFCNPSNITLLANDFPYGGIVISFVEVKVLA